MDALTLDDGLRLRYRRDGRRDGPALVFSNSLGTNLHMWDAQVAALGDALQLVRYDTRGHGGSSVTPAPYTLDRLGLDVLALLDGLGIERAHFCGISMGGLIGQWLGVHAPGRLLRLVVANTAARIGSETGWRERAQLVRERGMDQVAAGAAERWFTPGFTATQALVVSTLIERLRATSAEGYAACCDALAVADLRESIAAIPVPTLALAGSRDPVTTPADADLIAREVPGATRANLVASHHSNVEQAAAFSDAVIRFLSARMTSTDGTR